MKTVPMYLSGMKSRCFMLLTCLILLVSAISCSDDNFETNLPDEPQQLSKTELLKQYSKAELIEQALSRMPQTRANNSRVEMVTIKDSVSIRFTTTEPIEIHWDEYAPIFVTAGANIVKIFKFSDGHPSHSIRIIGTDRAIQSLTVDDNELISLKIKSNENLTTLNCRNNHLEELDLTGCPKLEYLYTTDNELTSLEIGHLSSLVHLYAENNQLRTLDASKNPKLFVLLLTNNRITHLEVSNNPNLGTLEVGNNLISSLNVANSPSMATLRVPFNPIADLDLSNNLDLMIIDFEGVPIKTLNNHPISDTSFVNYSILWQLNVAYTSFDSLNLSNNSILQDVDITGSEITQLNISDIHIRSLYATRSKLTDLIWGENGLDYLFEVRIERTPFEKDWDRLEPFIFALPPRTKTNPGHLYTYAANMNDIASRIKSFNWWVNQ